MKHCNRCGADNSDQNRYCASCGAELPSSYDSNRPSYASQREYGSRPGVDGTYYRTFQSAILTCLKDKYATFSGRSTRSEYWFFYLFVALLSFVTTFCGAFWGAVSGSETIIWGTTVISWIISLAMFVPGLSVSVRRLHDTDRSGWNMLWLLLPILGYIVYLVFMVLDSIPVDNEYGPAPHETR